MLATRGAQLLDHFDALDIDHVALPAGTDATVAVKDILANGEVLLAQPNYIRHKTGDQPPNEPSWREDQLWGLINIQAHPAWLRFGGGDGSVVLADIDTGVDYNHPDLAANMWQNPGEIPDNGIDDDGNGYIDDVHGIDTVNRDSDPMDDDGHGTHTTGLMAAVGNNGFGVVGVLWNAKVIACKFLDADGNGSDSGAIKCLDYLLALKRRGINIRVTNNSWGGKLGVDEPFPSVLKDAYDTVGAENIINVCAAGNEGTNNDADPHYPAAFDSPSIISVAASDRDDNRPSFSNYGAATVDLAAPGLVILSTLPASYGNLTGTSMATPFVSGAAGLLAQLNPSASVATLKSLLINNVDLLPQWAGLSVSGGRLNVYRAAQAAFAGTQPISVTSSVHPGPNQFELTWAAVPGMHYQVSASFSLTSAFASLSDVIVAGSGETSLTFSDLAITQAQRFYQISIVP